MSQINYNPSNPQAGAYPRMARRYERGRDAKMTANDLKSVSVGDLLEIAKDKWKSRSLQRSLMEHDKDMTELIYEKAEPGFVQLLSDQYGNYLSQKILEHCSDEQFDSLFAKVDGQLAMLANEVHGTRAVQKFVEEGIRRGRTQQVVSGLIDHVEPLSRSVTGFHVVVKLLEKLLPEKKLEAKEEQHAGASTTSAVSSEDPNKLHSDQENGKWGHEVLGRLCYDRESVVSMARDQWGCCVLKTCLDKAAGERLSFIVETIVGSTLELVQDPYGNYVVQHVLSTTTSYDFVLPQMIERLKDHVLDLCQQKFSSNVLEKVLTTAPESHRNMLIEGVVNAGKMDVSNVVQHLLFHQYGNYVLQQTLTVSRDPYQSQLIDAIRPFVHAILRHMLEGEMPSHAPIPRRTATTLAPEQAQRLAVKLAKRFPVLLEGMEDHEKAMLNTPSAGSFHSRSDALHGGAQSAGSSGAGYSNSGGSSYDYASLLNLQQSIAYGSMLYSPADIAAAAALQSMGAAAGLQSGLPGKVPTLQAPRGSFNHMKSPQRMVPSVNQLNPNLMMQQQATNQSQFMQQTHYGQLLQTGQGEGGGQRAMSSVSAPGQDMAAPSQNQTITNQIGFWPNYSNVTASLSAGKSFMPRRGRCHTRGLGCTLPRRCIAQAPARVSAFLETPLSDVLPLVHFPRDCTAFRWFRNLFGRWAIA
ncbi:unnamed protein product [Amoebophrya sp. A120]|nr:unnamed protein product [Amoebophrya sp. A120]|eukprot:GSA120T00015310001.1